MILIGARLSHGDKNAAGSASVFGAVVCGEDAELLDGFNADK